MARICCWTARPSSTGFSACRSLPVALISRWVKEIRSAKVRSVLQGKAMTGS
jgi:hypothetical protein